MKERIKTLQEVLKNTALEVTQLREMLKQKEAMVISIKGGIAELQRLVQLEDEAKKLKEDEAKKLKEVTLEEKSEEEQRDTKGD